VEEYRREGGNEGAEGRKEAQEKDVLRLNNFPDGLLWTVSTRLIPLFVRNLVNIFFKLKLEGRKRRRRRRGAPSKLLVRRDFAFCPGVNGGNGVLLGLSFR
jgi:hypothetical protein